MIRLDKIKRKSDPKSVWNTDEISNYDSISSESDSSDNLSDRNEIVRPAQEILWNDEDIWKSLQSIENADKIIQLIQNEDLENILSEIENFETSNILLFAVWLRKNDLVEEILKEKPSLIHTKDPSERPIIHLAAYTGNVEALSSLIKHGASVNSWDNKHKVEPLHCAASKGNLDAVKLLLRHGADVNSGIRVNKSPLHFAVSNLAVECVVELLENGANPNTTQIFSETPLHVAASLGSSRIIELLLNAGAAVNVHCGMEKVTPLHLASGEGDLECVRLLLGASAPANARNSKRQTPLHLAALSQCSETIELLLKSGADPNVVDIDGRTPLHCSIVKVTRTCDCVRILLKYGSQINRADSFGYTPLHLAALNEFSHCVMYLINNGGDVTARTNGGISVLNFITRRTPDVIPKYKMKFDESIRLNDHEVGDVDCELKLDFRALVPTVGNKETELLLNFIEVGHKTILKHPLCQTFLFLKWRRIRKFFVFSLIYHSIFVTLFSFYILAVFLKDCTPSPNEIGKKRVCEVGILTEITGTICLVLNILLLAKEVFQLAHSWDVYVKHWENWLQWMIVICVFLCVTPNKLRDIQANIKMWQHHVAAIGIFLTWLELMMLIGRFPTFGIFIQMFTTVSVNFVKFITAYFCLLLAFAFSFGVIFANYKSFKKLLLVLIKVIVMMSGELEYEDIFFDSDTPVKFPFTAQVMFLIFVILVTIILTNLMVGLAVSDIQGLQTSAVLDRLVRQVELVAHLESMLFSKLLICVPNRLLKFLHNQSLLLKSQYHWALYIRPNDPRETRIPKELIRDIYNLVVEKKERAKKRNLKISKQISTNTDSAVVSPELSRMNSYMSYVGLENVNDKNVKTVREQLDELNTEFASFTKSFKRKFDKIQKEISSEKLQKSKQHKSFEKDYYII